MHKQNYLIVAGGTGGHVLPGITLSQELHQKTLAKNRILFLTIERNKSLPDLQNQNFDIVFYDSPRLPVRLDIHFLTFPWRLLKAIIRSLSILLQYRIDVLIGFGSYASFPAILAALLLRKTIYLCEQNTIAGMTTKLLARCARYVFINFPVSNLIHLKKEKLILTGNPLRPTVIAQAKKFAWKPRPSNRPLHILVLGGSQGAMQILRMVIGLLKGLEKLTTTSKHTAIFKKIHWSLQCGTHYSQMMKSTKSIRKKFTLNLFAYSSNIEEYYKRTDILLCRAGAGVLSEALVYRLPMIVIPLPNSADDHQLANARMLEKSGAAKVLDQTGDHPDALYQLLCKLLADKQTLVKLHQGTKRLAKTNAVQTISKVILNEKS